MATTASFVTDLKRWDCNTPWGCRAPPRCGPRAVCRWPRSVIAAAGGPPKLLRRDAAHQPLAVRELALRLAPAAYRTVTWREGSAGMMRSRFAAVGVRAAHRDYWQAVPNREQWLLIEWPKASTEPAKYW